MSKNRNHTQTYSFRSRSILTSFILSTLKFEPGAIGIYDSIIPMMLADSNSVLNALSYLDELTSTRVPEIKALIEEAKKIVQP